jgi:hypothetical protein
MLRNPKCSLTLALKFKRVEKILLIQYATQGKHNNL